MYIIGANPHAGLFTKDQYLAGKIPAPGTRAANSDGEGTKEFIVVKFTAGATHVNGSAVTINGDSVAALTTVPSGSAGGARVGILTFASATATQTVAGTAFAWAQIYGKALARAGTVSAVTALGIAADGALGNAQVAGTAKAYLQGVTAITTQAAAGLLPVLLQYPMIVSNFAPNS